MVGVFMGPVVYFYVPVTLFFLKSGNKYMEILLGFFLILTISDSRSENLRFAVITKEVYVIMMAIFLLIDLKSFRPFNRFFVRFIPFFLVAFICIFNGPDENYYSAFEKTISYILLLVVVPNYVLRAHLDHGKEFYKIVMVLSTLVLCIGFIFKIIDPGFVTREGRFEGVLGNPNGLGIYALLSFLLLRTGLELHPSLFNKRERNIMYAAILLSIILSGSRSSLFGLLIFMIFSYLFRLSPYVGAVLALIVMGSYGYISENLVGIINKLGLENYLRTETLEAGSGRFVAWKFTWDHIQESYWFGRGFEYTTYLFSIPENVVYLQSLGHIGNIHNSYLTLWLDTGLVGLVCYMLAFLSYFIKAASRTRLALPVLFTVVFSSFFESWLTASLNPFTIQVVILLTIFTSDAIFPAKAKAAVSVQ